jgi:adenosylcobinamide amidohydrolase
MSGQTERVLYEDEHVRAVIGPTYAALRLHGIHAVASFAPHGGGLRTTQLVVIHEVRNADLPIDVDPLHLLAERMRQEPSHNAVGMLTSRRIASAQVTASAHAGCGARVLCTAGFSNAVRVGDAPGPLQSLGTINLICHLDVPLSEVALLEALTIVTEARTLAVHSAGIGSRRSHNMATGTGTDCIAVLSPAGDSLVRYAGKHTSVGYVLGDAALRAVEAGIIQWKLEVNA